MFRRGLAVTIVSFGLMAMPTHASAAAGAGLPDDDARPQGPEDAIECWIPSAPLPPGSPTIWRLRPDGVTEILMASGRRELLEGYSPLCTEVLPGVYVYTPDAPAVAEWLVDANRRLRGVVVIGNEEVPDALDLYWWNLVAECESGGHWHIATGNGFYGGLQIHPTTWAAYGGLAFAPRPDLATVAQQIDVARAILDGQGPGAWPVCSQWAR